MSPTYSSTRNCSDWESHVPHWQSAGRQAWGETLLEIPIKSLHALLPTVPALASYTWLFYLLVVPARLRCRSYNLSLKKKNWLKKLLFYSKFLKVQITGYNFRKFSIFWNICPTPPLPFELCFSYFFRPYPWPTLAKNGRVREYPYLPAQVHPPKSRHCLL